MSELENSPVTTQNEGGKFLPALCSILGTLLMLAVIICCLPAAVPRVMGMQTYNVISASMEPELPVGSLVAVKEAKASAVQVGEIIAFESNGTVVTHRVTDNYVVGGRFTTKGDANEAEDINPVSYDQLIGVVQWHVPVMGSIMYMLSGTMGKVYLLLIAGCGLLLKLLAGLLRR